jgi:beta-lactamase regulating signal transducer with metallopeptidase domain
MSALLTAPVGQTLPDGPASSAIVEATAEAASVFTSEKLMIFVWLFGCGIGAAVLIAGSARLSWIAWRASPVPDDQWKSVIAQLRLKRSVRFRQSQTASILVTWGAWRPQVLLPANAENWSEDRVRLVFAHEFAHIRRNDWFVQILAETVRTFYWFNPLFWMACNRLRQESECACDDAVLGLGVDGTEYASELLELARILKNSNRAWSTAVAMAHPSTLERRFAAMLDPTIDRRSISRKAIFAALALSLCLVLPLAAMRAPIQSGPVSGLLSAGPASTRRTRCLGSALNRLASTQPADPAPTMM